MPILPIVRVRKIEKHCFGLCDKSANMKTAFLGFAYKYAKMKTSFFTSAYKYESAKNLVFGSSYQVFVDESEQSDSS